jgi:hypothetical protein
MLDAPQQTASDIFLSELWETFHYILEDIATLYTLRGDHERAKTIHERRADLLDKMELWELTLGTEQGDEAAAQSLYMRQLAERLGIKTRSSHDLSDDER